MYCPRCAGIFFGVSLKRTWVTTQIFINHKMGSIMNQAALKKYAMTGITVLAVLLVFNSIAKRVPAVAKVRDTVNSGL